MTTEQTEQRIRELMRLSLEQDAFNRVRTNLAAYSTLHAVADGASSRATPSFLSALMTPRMVSSFAILFLVLGTGAGATVAAEGAVPGEPLYAVKINFNEKVAATLADTSEERARHNASIAERRADEAIELASDGKLDAKTATYLAQEFDTHAAASNDEADSIESSGDVTTSLALRADLEKRIAARAFALRTALRNEDAESEAPSAEDEEAKAELADVVEERAEFVAAARLHTAASILRGLADTDHPLDIAVLRAGGQGEGQATIMSKQAGSEMADMPQEEATTTPERSKLRFEVNTETQPVIWNYTNTSANATFFHD